MQCNGPLDSERLRRRHNGERLLPYARPVQQTLRFRSCACSFDQCCIRSTSIGMSSAKASACSRSSVDSGSGIAPTYGQRRRTARRAATAPFRGSAGSAAGGSRAALVVVQVLSIHIIRRGMTGSRPHPTRAARCGARARVPRRAVSAVLCCQLLSGTGQAQGGASW
eukprot:6174559-Pleurochrysis_carterae.AAC.2